MSAITKAANLAGSNFPYKSGAFYGNCDGLALGVGLLYDSVRYPLFDADSRLFDTVAGLVYVLTHECDVDLNNPRIFNEYV